IVGIVGDFRSRSVTEPPEPEVYLPQAQMGSDYLTVSIRTEGGSEALLPRVKSVVDALDPDLPLRRVELLESAVDRSIGPTRFYFLLLTLFAALAVALAATGLYGVVVFLVSRRTREIGIRMALGARSGEVLRMVFVEAMRPALLGVAIGLAGAYLESKAIAALLYNVEPLDATVLGGVVGLMIAVAVVAVVAPARRATRISPATTLRGEG
ncbi:MAG: FtsX-like permease family protein, partial [Vicinamibacteria bacterium]